MKTRLAALFPGQGAIDGKILHQIATRCPQTREVFDIVDEVAGAAGVSPMSPLLFDGAPANAGTLNAEGPWASQLAIFGTDVAVFRILQARGVTPDVLVGHSLGEIPALVCAGAYSIADGARVVLERVRALQEVDTADGYLAALSTDPARTAQILGLIDDDRIVVAVENHAEQTVVSGPAAAMGTLRDLSAALGLSFTRLSSPFPFHGPLVAPAVERFATAIRNLPRTIPDVPVYSPILQRHYTADDDLAECLANHLITPVRFAVALRQLSGEGVNAFVECGALASLTKIVLRVLEPARPLAVAALAAENGQSPIETAVAALRTTNIPEPHVESGGAGSADRFDEFWRARGSAVLALVRQEFEDYTSAVGRPAADDVGEVSAETGRSDAMVSRDALAAELRSLYGQALEYPEEVFTDEVLLEGELGIDSVKQTELFTRVASRYGLAANAEDLRFAGLDTMGKVIDFVHTRLTNTTSTGTTR